jgi:hypothetical protein
MLLAAGCVPADSPARWSESERQFFTFSAISDAEIIALADSVLAPLGFNRTSEGTRYPDSSIPGIHASYSNGDKAMAILVEASRSACMVFSITNYDDKSPGLSSRATAAITGAFSTAAGAELKLFKDAECRDAL